MADGYERQDTTGQLANGNPIDAEIFNDEYDAIEAAFNASSGHAHDGTVGGGAPIESIGPSQELEVTSSAAFPKNDNLIDHGKSTLRWRNGYYGTDLQVGNDLTVSNDASVGGDLTVTGDTTINGNTTIGDANSDTVYITARVDSNIIPNTVGANDLGSTANPWGNLYVNATTKTDILTVDTDATVGGTLDVTGATGIDGDFDINTNKVTIEATTGNTNIAGTLGVADEVSFTGTTSATSTTTGAVVVTGGVGIAENLHVGGTLDVTGDMTVANLDATSLDLTGDLGVDGDFDVNTNKFTVAGATGNTNIAGTLGVTGNTTVAGTLDVTGNQTNTGDLTVNGNTTLGDAATDTVNITADVASNIIPDANNTRTLGDASNNWSHVYANAVTTTADVAVGGDVTITGDLTVSGTTTTVNSTTVDIVDLNITMASNAATAAAANGGGITVAGASATLTYDSTTDRWDMNKDLEVANVYANLTGNVTGNVTGNINGNVTGNVSGNVTGTVSSISNHLLDEDNMTSNSATKVPSQQSVKAYVDAAVAGDGTGDIDVGTVDADEVDLGGGDGSGWVIYQSGTDLKFKYNGTDRFKLSSTGALVVENDVTAYGAA